MSYKISSSPIENNREITCSKELRRNKTQRKEFSYENDFQNFLYEDDPLTNFDGISSSDAKL